MTLEEAYEYVEHAIEHESESKAEYGSGAVSMGYAAAEVMFHYDGYRTANDPDFKKAQGIIAANRRDFQSNPVWTPMSAPSRPIDSEDDIPF